METLFRYFASRPITANVFTVAAILAGLASVLTINLSEYPSLRTGQVSIVTRYPGASPADVEANVTNRIEAEIAGVTEIDRYVSTSSEGSSVINVTIKPEIKDIDKVVQTIRDAVSRVTDLPAEILTAPLIEEETDLTFDPVITLGVSGGESYRQLREFARQTEKKLRAAPGIGKVEMNGFRAREVQIHILADKVVQYQIPLAQVVNAIAARNIRSTGGVLESYSDEKTVAMIALLQEPGDLNDVIAFQIYRNEEGDIAAVADAAKQIVTREAKRAGFKAHIAFNQSTDITAKFTIVMWNGLIGLVLVLVTLAVALHWRMAFWVSISIPVCILGAIALMPPLGLGLDSLSLAALILAIGLIVDDSIIVSESIYRCASTGMEAASASVAGLLKVFKPVLTTMTTTIIAFMPLYFMSGEFQVIFVIPLVVSLALLLSLAETWIALPAHLIPGLSRHGGAGETRDRFEAARVLFCRLIKPLIRARYANMALALAALAASLWYAANEMRFTFFPTESARIVEISTEVPLGTSLEAAADINQGLDALLQAMDRTELLSFESYIATPKSQFKVSLTPYNERARTADEIVEDLRKKAVKLEGMDEIRFTIDAGGPAAGDPVELRIFGNNDAVREQLAREVMENLSRVPGVKDVSNDAVFGKVQINIVLDHDWLAILELDADTVARALRLAYDGQLATSVTYGDERVYFRVLLNERFRNRDNLSELVIRNKSGALITMNQIARLESSPGPSQINHWRGERSIVVSAEIDQSTTDASTVSHQIMNAFDMQDYPGVRMQIGGEAEETEKAAGGLLALSAVSILGMYLMLVLLFGSTTQPLIVLSVIPFSVAAVIFALAIHGKPLSFFAAVGALGLAGVVVNGSLVLVDAINGSRRENPTRPLAETVAKAAAGRLRPILLTTVTTVAGMLPLAYGIGGTDIFMGPMALAMGYGLLFSLPITLVLVPSLYMIKEDIGRLLSRIVGKVRSRREQFDHAENSV